MKEVRSNKLRIFGTSNLPEKTDHFRKHEPKLRGENKEDLHN
jgi:hypothetical protein